MIKSIQLGPLSNAYEFRSLHYNLAYHAFNALSMELESNSLYAEKLATEFGVTEAEMFYALEELYTNNADPDSGE